VTTACLAGAGIVARRVQFRPNYAIRVRAVKFLGFRRSQTSRLACGAQPHRAILASAILAIRLRISHHVTGLIQLKEDLSDGLIRVLRRIHANDPDNLGVHRPLFE
jgi:hypothetical protein